MTTTVRIAVVDDHEVVRRGLRNLFDRYDDLEVISDTGTYAEALDEITAVAPDVAVVDLRLPDGDGVDLCAELARTVPTVHCVVLTAYTDDRALVRAFEAGAAAFVLKEIDGSELVDAVRQAARGQSLLDSATTAYVVDRIRALAGDDPSAARLTPQERRIVALVSEGLMNRQIGEELGLSEKTVKNYVSNVLAKLNMAHRSEVAVYGARLAARGEHVTV